MASVFLVLSSNGIARSIGKLVTNPKSVIASDSLHLPRITENGVSLYDSVESPKTYLIINKLWVRLTPFFIVGLAAQPALATLTYGFVSYIYFVIV